MHRGVRELVRWLEDQKSAGSIKLQPPAKASDVQALEHDLGSPLPADLRLVLGRFNGASLPGGAVLLTAAPGPGTTIEAVLKELAAQKAKSFLDPDLLLPFGRTEHGSVLAFDRAAAPVADTWPVVDFDAESGETTIIHRTFDGWCRFSVGEWSAEDRELPFSLDKYLRSGARHSDIEEDVSIAHVTVGHALRRAGEPERALAAYLKGGRCVPPIPWADWEALKLAVLLDARGAIVEAGGRLAKRTRKDVWERRGTTPSRVAFVLLRAMRKIRPGDDSAWRRMFDNLRPQALDEDDGAALKAILAAVDGDGAIPAPSPAQPAAMELPGDVDIAFVRMREAYTEGQLRDDDLVLDPRYDVVAESYPLVDVLRIRREF
jgi:hypothetical protein